MRQWERELRKLDLDAARNMRSCITLGIAVIVIVSIPLICSILVNW